jgi:hypothetical protein
MRALKDTFAGYKEHLHQRGLSAGSPGIPASQGHAGAQQFRATTSASIESLDSLLLHRRLDGAADLQAPLMPWWESAPSSLSKVLLLRRVRVQPRRSLDESEPPKNCALVTPQSPPEVN